MFAGIYGEPWGYYCSAVPLSAEVAVSAFPYLPRLVTTESSAQFWDGCTPPLASYGGSGWPRHFDLPISHLEGHHTIFTHVDSRGETRYQLEAMPERVERRDRSDCPRESWLYWQYQRYNELARRKTQIKTKGIVALEAVFGSTARRTWPAVSELFQQGGAEEAEYSLIVELANDKKLVRALRSVLENPRKMLIRLHRQQRIALIQEMDSTTLRAYARAPGRTAPEKAGVKQVLQAVVREETRDLTENRLVLWASERIERFAGEYQRRNSKFCASARFQRVASLERLVSENSISPIWESIIPLSLHLESPTYCLQFEPRYRLLWNAYRKIRRQEKALDDAWKWQAHLWGTSARLILSSVLRCLPGWREERESTPYFRSETMQGEWVEGPSTPGPFVTPGGVCHVIDMRRHGSASELTLLGVPPCCLESGADWVMVWQEEKRVLLVWTAVSTGVQMQNASLALLEQRLDLDSRESGWNWSALTLAAVPEPVEESANGVETGSRAVVMNVSNNVHDNWSTLVSGVRQVVENHLER